MRDTGTEGSEPESREMTRKELARLSSPSGKEISMRHGLTKAGARLTDSNLFHLTRTVPIAPTSSMRICSRNTKLSLRTSLILRMIGTFTSSSGHQNMCLGTMMTRR